TGRHFTYSGSYTDLSPNFRADLGFVRRVNIRQVQQYASYFWRPEKRRVLHFGPTAPGLLNWDRKVKVRDWLASLDFLVYMTGQTELRVTRFQSFELLSGPVSPNAGEQPENVVDTGTGPGPYLGFRKNASSVNFSTARMNWLGFSAFYSQGTGVNYS